jgi:hypothetical protein
MAYRAPLTHLVEVAGGRRDELPRDIAQRMSGGVFVADLGNRHVKRIPPRTAFAGKGVRAVSRTARASVMSSSSSNRYRRMLHSPLCAMISPHIEACLPHMVRDRQPRVPEPLVPRTPDVVAAGNGTAQAATTRDAIVLR